MEMHAVGEMVFDPERKCWLGNESELQHFDFDSDIEPPRPVDFKGDESASEWPERQQGQLIRHEKTLDEEQGTNTHCCRAQALRPSIT